MKEGQSSTAVTLNIDEMASSIRTQLNYYHSKYHSCPHGQKIPLIHKVKKQIREVDPVAYEPIMLSIGPYHCFSPSVLAMQREKWRSLKAILDSNHQKGLQDYLTEIMKIEERVRNCYQDDINIESNKFIQMLLLDGCFLLYSLYATEEIEEGSPELYERGDRSKDIQLHERVSTLEMLAKQPTISISSRQSSVLATEAEQQEADVGQCTIQDPQAGHCPKPVIRGKWYTTYITRDMLLLENQIPFFVLELIYDIVAYKKSVTKPLTETLAIYIEIIVKSYPKAIRECDRPKDFHHLLHLCHIYFKPTRHISQRHEYEMKPCYLHSLVHNYRKYYKHPNQHEEANSVLNNHVCLQDGMHMNRWRRAIQYHEAGVQLKKREHSKVDPHSLLDIVFDNGVLEIPCLPVDDKTCSLFRNFVAFEQACPQFGNDLTAYVAFISQLISTVEDVTLLSRRGIIVHQMRFDGDVCNIFGKLGKNVDFDMNGRYYLKPLCQQLEKHYQNRINRWMAWLWQNHFSNPWMSLAVLAAAVVLVCTILQTLTSLLAYMNTAT